MAIVSKHACQNHQVRKALDDIINKSLAIEERIEAALDKNGLPDREDVQEG